MLRTSHHVKYRQCLLPVLCRFLSIQSVNLNKAPTISSDPDVRIVSRSSLKKKKSKRRKEPVAPSIPLSQRLRDASIKREIAAGDWNALPNDVSYNRKNTNLNFCKSCLTYFIRRTTTNTCRCSDACPWLGKGFAQVKCIYRILMPCCTHWNHSPGVHFLRDPKTKAYNFTPYLEDITQPLDFDYDSLQPYITSSKDTVGWFDGHKGRKHWHWHSTEPCGFSSKTRKAIHWIYIIRVGHAVSFVLCHVKLQTSKHFLFVPRIRKRGKQKQQVQFVLCDSEALHSLRSSLKEQEHQPLFIFGGRMEFMQWMWTSLMIWMKLFYQCL